MSLSTYKINKFIIIISVAIVLLYLLLLITTPFNAFPEFYFLPWLVSKGLTPYKDFFDHHGFILYYILAPLVKDKSLFWLECFYLITQLFGLTVFILILRKNTNKVGYIIGSLLYVLFNYYFLGNNIWYENIISPAVLLVYYLLFFTSFRYKNIILGLLLAFISLIKPSAVIFIIPVLIYTKSIGVVVSFILPWIFTAVFYFINKALGQLFLQLFLFNIYYARYMAKDYLNTVEKSTVLILVITLTIFLVAALFKKERKKYLYLSLFFLASFYSVLINLSWISIAPVIPYIIIFITKVYKHASGFNKKILLVLLLILLVFISRKAKFQYFYHHKDIPNVLNNEGLTIAQNIKKEGLSNERFYVFSNNPEVYYLLDYLPLVKFPFVFPWIESYFHAQDQIASDLVKNRVEYIYFPKNGNLNYLSSLSNLIKENYSIISWGKDYVIMKKK